MKNEFDEKHDLSQPPISLQNRSLELSPRQSEIYRNLEAIGPEIAAFYLSGVKVLQNDDLETSSYLLAHIAREIEGGLRDVFSTDQEKKKIQKRLKRTDLGALSERIGHVASILAALGIDDLGDPLAKRWISVATRFHEFAHRHGAWEAPRVKEAFVPLWHEFEGVLMDLVGNHFNLLNRIDHILHEKPTKARIKTLPRLLASEVRYAYFFSKLDSPAWLRALKDAGWFHPDNQPPSQEMPGHPVHFWHALEYVEKVANHAKEAPCEETFNILADIVNVIVDYTNDTETSVASDHTDWRVIKIICTLPIERIESRHITFIGISLKSRDTTLVNSAIGEIVLPKLLNGGPKELTLALLEVMLDAKVIDDRIIPVMDEYWLRDALSTHGEVISTLYGIEASRIALKQIQCLIGQNTYWFNFIQRVESGISQNPDRNYAELLVSFTSTLFRSAEPNSIVETVEDLLQKSHDIFRRIALNVITHHYADLKHLFWKWQGNPLEDTSLKPELYQLIQTNCRVFGESEIERVLDWIESAHYMAFADDPETRAKVSAYRRREWLSALMETGNKEILSAYQKYEQINPAKLEHPGLLWWTEVGWGYTSPVTVNVLSGMSNAQIAEFLNNFKQEGIAGPSEPSEEGLRETFEGYVATNPQRFTDDLQPFFMVKFQYQYALFQGFLKGLRDKKEFNWVELLNFIDRIFSSAEFWSKRQETRFDYRDWILSATAELIKAGTADDEHAFDVQLLPLAERILLVLVKKVKSDRTTISDASITVLNSTPEKVFSAMIDYALRFARTNKTENGIRWTQTIKADFTKRLDRNLETSFEFSFTLGAYLPNLLYLDKEWVTGNINRIFPQSDEYHWQAAFSGYLYNSQIYETLYCLLKEHGHYQKALKTNFADGEIHRGLVQHICTGWIEDSETLNDKTSLIHQLINNENPTHLSHLVHFFWRQRGNLPPKAKVKVRPTWRALYESFSQKDDIEKYGEVLSRLSGWVALVDRIDAEVLKWLKMSTQHIKGFTDSAFFVEELLPHATKTPAEVGEIYLGMLTHNIYPSHDQEHIQGIVRVLYRTGHKKVADRICNLYGEAGFDFLRSLYDENQN